MRRLTQIHRKHKLLFAVFMLVCSHGAVHAQVPDSAGVGQLQRQFTVKPQPQSKPPVLRERPQSKPLLLPNKGKTFLVKAIKFDPTTTIPVAILQERVSIFLNQPVTIANVYLIAAALTDYIREQGFLVSRVIVSQQGMENGVIRFKILEQGIADVVFQGDTRLINASIIKNIRERLLADVPLQRATLEQALLTLNRLSGVSAEAVLFSVSDNQIGLKITITQKRIEGIASIDNRGSHYVGPWQGSIGSTLNGLLAPFDQFSVRGISATDNQEMRGTDSNYQIPLNSLGTALKLSYARVWSEPGYTLRSSQLENVSTTYGIAIKHPLIQERSRTISIDTQFNIRNASSKTFGAYISDDKTRSITAGLTLDTANSTGGSTYMNTSFSQGLNILGARKSGDILLSRANGRSDFSKVETYISRTQALTEKNSAQIVVNGQYAFTQLLSGEEFAFGGSQFGRGYESSEITGDHGIAALLELQHRPTMEVRHISNTQLYASYDFGSVWAIDTDTRFNKRTAASAAVGIRFDVNNRLSVDTQLAKPLTRPIATFNDSSSNNPRAFMSAVIRF